MPASRFGLLWGFLGVLAFSFTLPFTRVAVGGLSPLFIGCGRAVVAALLLLLLSALSTALFAGFLSELYLRLYQDPEPAPDSGPA